MEMSQPNVASYVIAFAQSNSSNDTKRGMINSEMCNGLKLLVRLRPRRECVQNLNYAYVIIEQLLFNGLFGPTLWSLDTPGSAREANRCVTYIGF